MASPGDFRPKDELENGIEALALFHRGLDDGFRLIERQPVILARVEDRRVAENDQARPRPHLEMAEPELFIDQAEGLVERLSLFRRRLDVRESEELKHLVLGPPDAAELVLGPAARAEATISPRRALARPAARLEILFENLDGAPSSRSS